MTDIWRVVHLLSLILGECDEFAKGETYWHCPFCHHYKRKLAINLYKKKWHCWKCGASGSSIKSLLRRLEIPPYIKTQMRDLLEEEISIKEDVSVANLSLPDEYKPLWMWSKDSTYKTAISYLKKRNISPGDVFRFKLGYCESGRYKNRIILPSYDSSNTLNYFVARDFYEWNEIKYLNPPISKNIVSFENHINWKEPIILCEGYFDALKIKWNAVPLLGTFLQEKIKMTILEKKVDRVYVCLDHDAIKKSLKICNEFMNEGIETHNVVLDNNTDPADYDFEDLLFRIREAPEMNLQHYLYMRMS